MLKRLVGSLLILNTCWLVPLNATASLIFTYNEESYLGESIFAYFEFADDAFSDGLVSGSWINESYRVDHDLFFTGNGDTLLTVYISAQWDWFLNHEVCPAEDYYCIDFVFYLNENQHSLLGEFWILPIRNPQAATPRTMPR
jgi:hypothetical protein